MANMIEVKHEVVQVLSMKTRGAATLILGDNPNLPKPVLAKVGVSPPPDCSDHNQYIVELFLNREPGQKTMTRPFVSVRDQWIKGMDVFRLERMVTLNLDYDFKRRPVSPRMVATEMGEHLAFDTIPWKTVVEGRLARKIFDSWRKTKRHVLKTMEDWEIWEDHYLTMVALEVVRKQHGKARLPFQVTEEGSIGILKRMFLRAYARSEWGLQRTKKYREVLEELECLGCPVTPYDAKNGNKGGLIQNVVPRTPRTEEFLLQLVLVYPELDHSMVFIIE